MSKESKVHTVGDFCLAAVKWHGVNPELWEQFAVGDGVLVCHQSFSPVVAGRRRESMTQPRRTLQATLDS